MLVQCPKQAVHLDNNSKMIGTKLYKIHLKHLPVGYMLTSVCFPLFFQETKDALTVSML